MKKWILVTGALVAILAPFFGAFLLWPKSEPASREWTSTPMPRSHTAPAPSFVRPADTLTNRVESAGTAPRAGASRQETTVRPLGLPPAHLTENANPHSPPAGLHGNQVLGEGASIAGGVSNQVDEAYGVIAGGLLNYAKGLAAFVGGGVANTALSDYSVAAGGWNNVADGDYATVPGGEENVARGQHAFAAGYAAQALHDGTFVWADDSGDAFASDRPGQFKVRAAGGMRFSSTAKGERGVELPPGGASWRLFRNRAAVTNRTPVEARKLLEKVRRLPIYTWSRSGQTNTVRHIGPLAEDFNSLFGPGGDPRALNSADAQGVALGAIQGLYDLVREQDARIRALEAENRALQRRSQ